MERQGRPFEEGPVRVWTGETALAGNLAIPAGARGLVFFAHGSGSSRYSPGNRYVARALRQAGLATLLFDLLTAEEELEDARTGHLRFDVPLLARRLAGASDWAGENPGTRGLRLGYFGASTGAAAALVAAAERPEAIGAIVSRGGHPDLATAALPRVRAPTLLIVAGEDVPAVALNRDALARLRATTELAIVPGATRLFEEPGALEQVARLAAGWFGTHLQ